MVFWGSWVQTHEIILLQDWTEKNQNSLSDREYNLKSGKEGQTDLDLTNLQSEASDMDSDICPSSD